jgi:hypothetical protein
MASLIATQNRTPQVLELLEVRLRKSAGVRLAAPPTFSMLQAERICRCVWGLGLISKSHAISVFRSVFRTLICACLISKGRLLQLSHTVLSAINHAIEWFHVKRPLAV